MTSHIRACAALLRKRGADVKLAIAGAKGGATAIDRSAISPHWKF